MPAKLTFEYIKNEFKKRNYLLEENHYTNDKTRMSYYCLKHPEKLYEITYAKLRIGQGCPQCGHERTIKSRLKTNEQFVEEIKAKNPNITILGKYINNKTPIEVQCNIDNHIWFPAPCNLLRTQGSSGCPICSKSGKQIIKGINDLAMTHPHIAKLIVNQDLIHSLSYGMNKIVQFCCPDCNKKFERNVNKMCNRNFSCPFCGDGISFPERFMRTLLKSLLIEFEYNIPFDWSEQRKYDFYIKDKNLIIETHGLQHYEEVNFHTRTLKEEQENDILKYNLANENNINKYIIIDCRYSEINFIKESILNSELTKIYDLSKINWNIISKESMSNLMKKACILWTNGLSCGAIATELKLTAPTITEYLKLGNEIGLCIFNSLEAIKRGNQTGGKKRTKKCVCLTTNELFKSSESAAKKYSVSVEAIRNCCRGNTKYIRCSSKQKLIFKYYNYEVHGDEYNYILI